MQSLKDLGKFLDGPGGLAALAVVFIAIMALAVKPLRRRFGRRYLGQALVILGMLLVCGIFLLLSFWFPAKGEVTAAAVPRLWIAGIVACCIYLLSRLLRGTEDPDAGSVDVSLPVKFAALTFAYLVLMPVLGYFIASLLFLPAAMILLSYRRRIVIATVALGWTAFSYIVFYRMLFVPLPEGILLRAFAG